jgi:hypothetical protein
MAGELALAHPPLLSPNTINQIASKEHSLSEKDSILTFLSNCWGPEESYVYLATKPEPDLWKITKPQKWPENSEQIVQFIIAYNAQGKDIYFSPATYVDNPTAKDKENVKSSRVLAVDIDGYKDAQTAPDAALVALKELGLPEPTYRLQSSQKGAEHWYWILDKQYPPEQIEDMNRRLAYSLNADKACWDIPHVFRPPFTHNHKPIRKNKDGSAPMVTIAHFSRLQHSLDSFNAVPDVKAQIKEMVEFSNEIPQIGDVLAKYPWDNLHLDIFKMEKKAFWKDASGDYENRGQTMMRLAYFCAEVGMTDEAMYAVINDCDTRWEKFVGRHDRDKQMVAFINRARLKYPTEVFAVVMAQDNEPIKQVYTIKEFLESDYKFDWILDGLITKNSINSLSSRPGTGKSRLTLQLSKCLATGEDFLGFKNVAGPMKVMYLSLEMGGPVLKYFIESLVDSTKMNVEEIADRFLLVPQGEPLALANTDGAQFFDYLLEEHKPDFMIIDAMSSLSHEEIGEKVAKQIMAKLKSALNKYGITFMLIHHNKKGSELNKHNAPTIDDFYGNTFGTTDFASMTALWNPPNKRFTEFHPLKTRVGASPKPLILNGKDQFTFEIETEQESTNGDIDGQGNSLQQFGFGTVD